MPTVYLESRKLRKAAPPTNQINMPVFCGFGQTLESSGSVKLQGQPISKVEASSHNAAAIRMAKMGRSQRNIKPSRRRARSRFSSSTLNRAPPERPVSRSCLSCSDSKVSSRTRTFW